MGKQAIPGASRSQVFYVNPWRATVVGRDTSDGPEHALYDERATRAPDEARVRNIRVYGVKEAVKIRKNGKHEDGPWSGEDVLEVIDGRGRTIDCRVAYDRALEAGEDPPLLKVEFERSDEDTQVGVMISLNEQRHDDTPMNRARKAGRLLANGRSREDVATMFGVTPQAVSTWQHLLGLSKKVQKAVDAERISASAAIELRELSHPEQNAKLAELLEHTNGKRPTKEQTRQKVQPDRPPRLTKSVAKRLVDDETWMQTLSPDAAALCRFLAGDQEALRKVPGLQRMLAKITTKPEGSQAP